MIHVDSVNGSDLNAGTIESPLRTIPAANTAARALISSDRMALVAVQLAPGDYSTPELYLGEGAYPDVPQVSWRGSFQSVGSAGVVVAMDGDASRTLLAGVTGPLGLLAQIRRVGQLVLPEIPLGRQVGDVAARIDVDLRGVVQDGDVVQAVLPAVRIAGEGVFETIGVSGRGPFWIGDNTGPAGPPNGWCFEGLTFRGTLMCWGNPYVFADRCVFEGADNNFEGGRFYCVNCIFRGGSSLLMYGGCKNGHDQAGARKREPTINSSRDAPQMEFVMSGGGVFILGFDGGDSAASGGQWVQERNLSIYDSNRGPIELRGASTVFKMQRPPKARNRLLSIQGDGNAQTVRVREGARLFVIPERCGLHNDATLDDVSWEGNSKAWSEVAASAAPFRSEVYGTLISKDWV